MKLSLAVIALNEEDRLTGCLESVPFAFEKVVVDSGSTDSTASVALGSGARVLQREFTCFSEQKQFAVDSCTGDWILVLDADESLSPALVSEIIRVVETGEKIAYRLPRRVLYMGRLLRFGPWSGETVLRLFPRGCASFDSSVVHEKLVPTVPVAVLKKGWIEHRTYRSLGEQISVTAQYAELWAEGKHSMGVRSSLPGTLFRAQWRFVSSWMFRGGFLEGYPGFMACCMSAFSVFLKWSLLREKRCER